MDVIRLSQRELEAPSTDADSDITSLSANSSQLSLAAVTGSLRIETKLVPGHRTLEQALDKISSWRQLIITAEQRRLRRAHQDQ